MRYGAAMLRSSVRSFAVSLSSFVLVSALSACPPSPPDDGGGGEGEGEGEEGEGEGEGEGELGDVVISEVACAGTDWVELVNLSTTDVALTGWGLSDDAADPTRTLALSGTLSAGARIAVDVAGTFGIACDETVSLLQGGRVRDETTLAVARSGATWARLPEPLSSSTPFGEGLPTRGALNVAFALGQVRINEIDCRGNDRIELVNSGNDDVDVGGFVVAIDPTDPAGRYALPAAVLAGGARLVVSEADATAVPPVEGFGFDVDCNGPLLLLDASGAPVDSVVLERTAEAFSYGRLPDATGDFAANTETIGAPNVAAALLAPEVFDDATVHDVVVDVDPALRPSLLALPSAEVPCSFVLGDDAAVDCVVRQERAGRFVIGFDDSARFRGLENLVVDVSDEDPTHLRALVAARAFAASTVIAPRAGFARARIAGEPARIGNLIEVLDGRRLRRELPSTAHVYESGPGPRDIVENDVGRWTVTVGDVAVRDDLNLLADVLETHRTTPGLLQAAGPVLAVGATLRFLAADAWLDHTDGYARGRGDVVVHFDDDGEGRLLPGDGDATLRGDGALYPAGSVLVDACLVDDDCALLYDAAIVDVDAAVDALGLPALVDAWAGLVRADVVDADAFDVAVAALRARLVARPDEVAAQRAARAP
jgi:hypothetical protein